MSTPSAKLPRGTRLCRFGSWAAAIGALLIAVSAGHKLGFLPSWQLAFLALGLGGLAMLVAFITTGIGLLRSGGSAGAASRPATWLAFIASLLFLGNTWLQMRGAFGAPPIHDVSTDTANPPQFVDVVPLRATAGAANPPEYAGAETAELQARGYPDIETIVLPVAPNEAFRRAEAAARELGWEMVASVPAEGRIEATASTAWIGFKDDVVIRIAGTGTESRVDIRSKSRVGRGDAGMNARRIRAFRDALTKG
jgi:uncharacterized protein (DUF1499 family)